MRTRRKFLLNCSAVVVTASVTPAGVFGASHRLLEIPLEQIAFATFAGHLNATFDVQSGTESAVGLQLVDASPTPAPPAELPSALDAANEKFSLLFSGPLTQPLEQDTYWFECQTIGRFAMFIVPIGSTETTQLYYEAVFNRPPSGQATQAISRGRAAQNLPRPQQTNRR